MRALRERIERVAATDFTVLIEGETGGQGTRRAADPRDQPAAAGAIRRHQLRRARRNAARGGAVRHRGTHGHRRARPARQVRARRRRHAVPRRSVGPVVSAQAKLLRAIQDFAVERVGGHGPGVSTSGSSPRPTGPCRGMVERGLFRADLYLPVERRRGPGAAAARRGGPTSWSWREHFLDAAPRHAARSSCRRRRSTRWSAYDWPGNVRELERVIERAVALAAERARSSWTTCRRRCAASTRRRSCLLVRARRHDAGVGQPLRAARSRAMPRQQAASVPRARDQLSHAAGVPALSGPTTTGRLMGRQ